MTAGFVFPGQGSQEVGMLADLMAEPLVAATFAEANDVLALPLSRIVSEGPDAELNRTEITQPALLSASVALWRTWIDRGGESPVVMAGHSLGEYSALVCAGALGFAEAIRLVHLRGSLMQRAVPAGRGAMAAILGLDDAKVAECCVGSEGVVSPANFNAPGQVVIAGSSEAVDAAIARCQAAGAKRAIRLAVSVPSHCALMAPIADEFAEALRAASIQSPRIPIVQNVDAEVSHEPQHIRERLVRQLSQPVRWTHCVERMKALGVTRYVECGPGKVLGALIKRIDRAASTASLGSQGALEEALLGGRA